MPQKYRRSTLKSKETKQVLTLISKAMKVNLDNIVSPKANIEKIETDFGQLFLINGKPLFFETKKIVFPILTAQEILEQLPKVVVDMGAVRFVCNGADIMAPGIVRYKNDFSKGDLVVVVDERHEKPLALGEALYNYKEAKDTRSGAVISTIHFVNDKIWDLLKRIVD
jgi:PUA-domain protein